LENAYLDSFPEKFYIMRSDQSCNITWFDNAGASQSFMWAQITIQHSRYRKSV